MEQIRTNFLNDNLFNQHLGGTCAVMFSSYILLEQEYGEFIDSHDYVLRFNFAPTKNYEKHVGSKTTHRLLGGASGASYNFKESDEMILRPIKNIVHDKRYLENDFINSSIDENKDFFSNYGILPPVYCSTLQNPSNGFLGLNFALHTFDKVSLFGFEIDAAKKYHYFNDEDNLKYVEEVMKKTKLTNPNRKIVSSAVPGQAFLNHPLRSEKTLITKMIDENDNLFIEKYPSWESWRAKK